MQGSLQYSIYKGTGGNHGALQLNFQKPHFYNQKQKDFTGDIALEIKDGKKTLKPGWKEREGAIFLEITSTKEKNIYDWENKIVMALSVDDMGKVLYTLLTGEECKIIHDPGAKSSSAGEVNKLLSIISPQGVKAGCIVTATQTTNGNKVTHKVPVTASEVIILRSLLNSAVSRALNW